MRKIEDFSLVDRLLALRTPHPWEGTPVDARNPVQRTPYALVRHDVPPIFEAYVRILHPIYENLEISDFEETWQDYDSTQEIPKDASGLVRIFRSAGTLERSSPQEDFIGRRITWRSLAEIVGLEFRSTLQPRDFTRLFRGESWPRRLVGPSEGRFEPAACDALARILSRHTAGGRAYFYFDCFRRIDMKPDLRFGALEEIAAFWSNDPEFHAPPAYWFDEKPTWCVNSDWDSSHTLVGGSCGLVDELLASSELECVRVDPDTRTDRLAYDADETARSDSPSPRDRPPS